MKLLAGRDKSRAQLRAALEAKGLSPLDVDEALQRCEVHGYLSDSRAAAELARRLYSENRSTADVRRRLQARGLDPAVAEELGHDDKAAAQRLLASKGLVGAKAARFLLGRLFEEELVVTLVDVPDAGE